MRFNPRMQFFHLKRLRDVIHAAGGERLDLIHLLGESADEDDGNSLELFVGFKVFAHLVAVHLRHIDVEQNQVRRIAPRCQQRQFTGGNRANPVAAVLEHAGQYLEIGGRIVHDQDAGGRPSTTIGLRWIQEGLPY